MNNERISDLLYQALQTEQDGGRIYETAIRCATREGLKDAWAHYLHQTRRHEQVLLQVFETLGLDPHSTTPGRERLHHVGRALVEAMEQALRGGPSEQAELLACECVVHAETKDQLNWELLGQVAGRLQGDEARALAAAHHAVVGQEEEHVQHTRERVRELWLECLGLVAGPVASEARTQPEDAAARARSRRVSP